MGADGELRVLGGVCASGQRKRAGGEDTCDAEHILYAVSKRSQTAVSDVVFQ